MQSRALPAAVPISVVAIAVLLVSILLAPPPVEAAKGTDIQPTATVLVGLVSPGHPGAFSVTFANTGRSTITDLGFTGTVSGGVWDPATLPAGCGSTGATVTCPVGTLPSGAPTVSFLFLPVAAEPAGGVGAMTFSGLFAGDASQNNEQAARRDTWPVGPASATVDSSAEVFGSWQQPHAQDVAYDPVGSAFQRTQVTAAANPANGYAVFVGHVDAAVNCTSGDVLGALPGFGHAIDVSVNAGQSAIDVRIEYAAASLGNTPPSQVDLVHERNGACELVPRDCAANAGGPAGCFDLTVVGRGKSQTVIVEAQLPNNGRVKGV